MKGRPVARYSVRAVAILMAVLGVLMPRGMSGQSPTQGWHADYFFEYDGARTTGDELLDVVHADWTDTWRLSIHADPNGTLAAPTITVNPAGDLGSVWTGASPGTTLNTPNPPYVWVGSTLNPSSALLTELHSSVVPAPYPLGYIATRNLVGGRTVQAGATENRTFTVTLTPTDPALTEMGTTIHLAGFQPGPVSITGVSCAAPDGQVQHLSSPDGPMVHWGFGGGPNPAPLPSNVPHTLTCALTLTNTSAMPALYTPSLTISGQRRVATAQSVSNAVELTSDVTGDPPDPLGTVRFDVTPSQSGAVAQATTHFVRTVHFDSVNQPVCSPISLNGSLPGGTAGAFYSYSLFANGGTAPYNFSVSSGGLPPGLTLSPSGTLSGNPGPGTNNFTVRATDANGCSGSQSYALTIQNPPPPPPNNPPTFVAPTPSNGSTISATAGAPVTFSIRASDPDSIDTVMLTLSGGSLPAGASFPNATANPVQATFSWTPGFNQAGSYPLTFRAMDNHGDSTSVSVTINVTVPSAPPFLYAIPTPAGACLCSPLLMNNENAQEAVNRQQWYVQADSSGTLNLRLYAHAINKTDESGSMSFTLFDSQNLQIGSVTVLMPTGNDPQDENSATLVASPPAGAIYRLQVDLGLPTSPTATRAGRHYRFEIEGAVQAAQNSPGIKNHEGVHGDQPVRWGLNVAADEPLVLAILAGPTDPNSPLAQIQVRLVDPSGVVRFNDAAAVVLPRTITIADAGDMPGQWRLDVVQTLNGHYQLDKQSGADRGIYLNWLTTGTGRFNVSLTRAGGSTNLRPINLTFTNTTTGQVTSYMVSSPSSFSQSLPVGAYTVTAAAPDGQTYSVTPASVNVDLWCQRIVTLAFDVPNRPPTVSIPGAPFTMTEGGPSLPLSSISSDPDGEPVTWAWQIVSGPGTLVGPTNGSFASYSNNDGPGSATVRVTVTDSLGASASATAAITVLNAAPTVSLFGPNPLVINEGQGLFNGGSFFDRGGLDAPWTATVDYGDGGGAQPLGFTTSPSGSGVSGSFSLSHVYTSSRPIPYTVTVTVTDKDGGVGIATKTVQVNNVAPQVFMPQPPPGGYAIDEGQSIVTCGSFFDPATADGPWVATVDYGDGTGAQPLSLVPGGCGPTPPGGFGPTGSFSLNHVYRDNGLYTVTVSVADKDGGIGGGTPQVTVRNVVPVITGVTGPIAPMAVNSPASVTASFTDAGTLDTHTCAFTWGDETTSGGSVSETAGSGSCTGTHSYSEAGVYVVAVTVTDKDGGTASSQFQYIVVYNTEAGFVTGGGWINSPAGAYAANPALAGRANFGFLSKYQRGATVPTGRTDFHFKAGDLNFQSTSYDWLIVAGARAQYKGSGTINGSGDYGFMLTAIDGQVNGGGDVDRFRIKIVNRATDSVVYDNQAGAGDQADPATTLGGGSIVIHRN